jgi:hypothetical protein
MNVISFSVWGKSNFYQYGVLENCCLVQKYYPNFQCWIFHNTSLFPQIKNALIKMGTKVKLIAMQNTSEQKNLMWRFLPAFNKNVNVFLSRDADSRITEREAEAVEEWLKSDKDFHIMRDHGYHKVKIWAGLFGCRNQIMVPHLEKYLNYIKTNKGWSMDEDFLDNQIYEHIVEKSFIHASRNKFEKHAVNFPRKCNKDEKYIGNISKKIYLAIVQFPEILPIPVLIKRKENQFAIKKHKYDKKCKNILNKI